MLVEKTIPRGKGTHWCYYLPEGSPLQIARSWRREIAQIAEKVPNFRRYPANYVFQSYHDGISIYLDKNECGKSSPFFFSVKTAISLHGGMKKSLWKNTTNSQAFEELTVRTSEGL